MRWVLLFLLFSSCFDDGGRELASSGSGTFGPEFTFTNNSIIAVQARMGRGAKNNGLNDKARERLIALIHKNCLECRIRGGDLVRVSYPDGFWFEITLDQAVVEVTAKPMTTAEIAQYVPRLQHDLFDLAAEVGVWPHGDVGGGHIHLGVDSHFGNNADLFRRFITDYYNHPELAKSILRDNSAANPHFVFLKEGQVERLRRILESEAPIDVVAERISSYVYTEHPEGFNNAGRYQAMNFTNIVDSTKRTLEIRAVRPQQTAEDFYKIAQLFEARIEYLKKNAVEMSYGMGQSMDLEHHLLAFIKYVDETGLRHLDYLDLLPAEFLSYIYKVINSDDFDRVVLLKIAKSSPEQMGEVVSELLSVVDNNPERKWGPILEALHSKTQYISHLQKRVENYYRGNCAKALALFVSYI